MKTTELLKDYLKALAIPEEEYKIEEGQDTLGYLITLTLKKDNPNIGVLRGKEGHNLETLKSLLRVVGATERIRPSIKLQYTE